MDLPTMWFGLVAVLAALYVLLDGMEIGAGICHLWLARTHDERVSIRRALGPVWARHEIWLLAAAGVLYFAFATVYERALDGFFVPVMLMLWLVVLRAAALAMSWSRTFGVASLTLALALGAGLGNLVRGVPIDDDGRFFAQLWTHFDVRGDVGVLDWYTGLVAVAAAGALTLHGALWIVVKTDGPLHDRARALAAALWGPLGLVLALMTYATFEVQPHTAERLVSRPWGLGFPALSVAAFLGVRRRVLEGRERPTFLLSCVFVIGLMLSAAFCLYPYLLPANNDPTLGLDIRNSAASDDVLKSGLFWWTPSVILAAIYLTLAYRRFAHAVRPTR